MPYTIRVRRDSSANWTGVVLAVGEVGYDSTNNQFRVGDGTTTWGTLSPIGGGNTFGTIAVAGQSNVVADQSNDTLTLAAGTNITLTTTPNTDTITIASTASGVTDGDKGDITVSASGATWTIDNGVITYAKIQDVSTTDRLLGRSSAGAGVIEEITCTSAGRALLDDVDATAQRATLSLVIGTDVQAYDAGLQSIAGLTTAANNILYTTALDTYAVTTLTTYGRSLIDDVDAAAARTTLGLGTIATQNSTNVSITGGSLEGVSVVTGTYSSPVNEAVLIKARKSTAGTINKGQIVYIVGSSGSHMTVELARADVESTSAYTIGVAATSITNTTDGYIMQQGRLTGLSTLPTATYANGDTIYLSESTAGGYRKTPPTAPNHGVFIGFVINASNGSAGELDVRIQNYQELSELSDVLISGIGANHMIVWDNTDLRWENKSPADTRTALGLGTLATQNGTFSGTSSGTNTGDQTITLTGDVTGSGTGSFATTLATVPISKGGTGQTTATAAFDALAPTTTAGDIIYYNGTDNIRLGIGTVGQVLKVNSGATAPEWGSGGSGAPTDAQYVTLATNTTLTNERVLTVGDHITLNDGGAGGNATIDWLYDPRKDIFLFNECHNTDNMTASNANGGSVGFTDGFVASSEALGVARTRSGANTNGRAHFGSATTDQILFGTRAHKFEARTRYTIGALSNATDRYETFIGFYDAFATGSMVDGAWFQYRDDLNGGKFECITSSNSTATTTDSGITVATTDYYKFTILVNAAGTEVIFKIDDTTVATHTTNIPTGSGRNTGFGVCLRKTGTGAGTADRFITTDYINLEITGQNR